MNVVEIIKEIESIALNIQQVKSCFSGDVYTNWNSTEIEYGSVNIAITAIDKLLNKLTYTIYLYYSDRLLQDKSNYNSIRTDTELVLNSIINTLSGEVDLPFTITFFEQQFADFLEGGYAVFKYTVDSNIGECSIEMDFTPVRILDINHNGLFDVTYYDAVNVHTEEGLNLQEKIVSDIQTPVTPDSDYDAMTKVTIGGAGRREWVYDTLPIEYQEVEYLESTGTQWINTGVQRTLNNVFRYVGTLSYTHLTQSFNDRQLNGVSGYFTIGAVGDKFAIGSRYDTHTSIDVVTNVFYDISVEYNPKQGYAQYQINNDYGEIHPDFNNPTTAYIAMFSIENGEFPSKCRIKDWQIYVDGDCVRHFIPCYRKLDNVAGMYDVINNQFYTNNGTGVFIVGNDTVRYAGHPEIAAVGGYQELEYIEGTGTQYLEINYKPNNNTKVECTMMTVRDNPNGGWFFGSRERNTVRQFCYLEQTSLLSTGSWRYGNDTINFNRLYNAGVLQHIVADKNKLYVNNRLIATGSNQTFTSPYNLHILCIKDMYGINGDSSAGSTTARDITQGRIYTEFTIYEDDVKLIELIPVRRLSDNSVGLYDIINNVFYGNIGAGEFDASEPIGGHWETIIESDGVYKVGDRLINVDTNKDIYEVKFNGIYTVGNEIIRVNV